MRHYFQDKSNKLGKRERTRSILIDGAIAAIAKHGLQRASIKEMTSVAGLSNGTFYNHFEDRDEIVRLAAYSVAHEIADDIAKQVSDVEHGLARIVISTDAFIDRALTTPEWGALIVDAAHNLSDVRHDVGKHLRADVALAIKQEDLSEMPNRFSIDQIGALIALAIEAQLEQGRKKTTNRQTCDAVLRLLGLPPNKARQTLDLLAA